MTTFLSDLPFVVALVPIVGSICVGLHRCYHHASGFEETEL